MQQLSPDFDPMQKVTQKNYALFVEHYRQSLRNINEDDYVIVALEHLFIYGFDQFSPLKPAHSFTEYQTYKKLWQRLHSYTSIRGHLKKLDFFQQQQQHAVYALHCLAHIHQHDFYCHHPLLIHLQTYAMGLLALFHPQQQSVFLENLLTQGDKIFDETDVRVFALYCEKMLVQFGEQIFSDDAQPWLTQLLDGENTKRRASESFAWKTQLDLALPLNDWAVNIYIDFNDDRGYVSLEIQDDWLFNWAMNLSDHLLKQNYHERKAFKTSSNHLDLPIFSEFGLIAFPKWLKTIEQQGYTLDWHSLSIRGLRKKADQQAVLDWLMAPFTT